jgi:hypothetical protein
MPHTVVEHCEAKIARFVPFPFLVQGGEASGVSVRTVSYLRWLPPHLR